MGSERPEDYYGHEAIRKYYDLRGGTEYEYTDFSRPANFPAEIAEVERLRKEHADYVGQSRWI